MPREDDRVELQVVTDLGDPLVLEHRLEHLERLAQLHTLPLVIFLVRPEQIGRGRPLGQRDVARLPRPQGERQPDDGGAHGGGVAGKYSQAEAPGIAQRCRQRLHLIEAS